MAAVLYLVAGVIIVSSAYISGSDGSLAASTGLIGPTPFCSQQSCRSLINDVKKTIVMNVHSA